MAGNRYEKTFDDDAFTTAFKRYPSEQIVGLFIVPGGPARRTPTVVRPPFRQPRRW